MSHPVTRPWLTPCPRGIYEYHLHQEPEQSSSMQYVSPFPPATCASANPAARVRAARLHPRITLPFLLSIRPHPLRACRRIFPAIYGVLGVSGPVSEGTGAQRSSSGASNTALCPCVTRRIKERMHSRGLGRQGDGYMRVSTRVGERKMGAGDCVEPAADVQACALRHSTRDPEVAYICQRYHTRFPAFGFRCLQRSRPL